MDLDVCKQWHLAAKLFQTSKIITHFIQKERTVFMVFIRLPRRCFDELTISSQHSTKYPPIKYLPFDIFSHFFWEPAYKGSSHEKA